MAQPSESARGVPFTRTLYIKASNVKFNPPTDANNKEQDADQMMKMGSFVQRDPPLGTGAPNTFSCNGAAIVSP